MDKVPELPFNFIHLPIMKHSGSTILIIFLFMFCLFVVQCSEQNDSNQIRILDEIPEHIRDIENITIFPGDSEPPYTVELIPVQTFGAEGEPYLSSIINGVVDEDGRLIILDVDFEGETFPPSNRIHVFNPDGSYLTQIGRYGRGPGEFGLAGIPDVKAGKVYVVDISNSRLNIYSAEDYSFERTVLFDHWSVWAHDSIEESGMRMSKVFRHDGNLLARFTSRVPGNETRSQIKYLLVNTDGDVLNPEPLVFPGGFTVRPETVPPGPSISLPFMGTTITALSPDDALYSALTREFLIKKHDANGIYQSAIYYPVAGASVDLNSYAESSRHSLSNIRSAFGRIDEEIPESTSPLIALKVDDEHRIWAGVLANPDLEYLEWWILDRSGKLLAKLEHPRNRRIVDIKNGYLYQKEVDEETGTEFVGMYRIQFNEL